MANIPTTLDNALVEYLRSLEQRLRMMEQARPQAYEMRDATRGRVRIGLQADGKYGLRIWDATGLLRQDNTW